MRSYCFSALYVALMLSALGSAVAAADRQCPMVGGVPLCPNPPPPTPVSKAQEEARHAAILRQEIALLKPLASGKTPENCRTVVASARKEGRLDIAEQVEASCR